MEDYPYMPGLKASEAELKAKIERLKLSTDPLERQSIPLHETHLRNVQNEIRKHTPAPIVGPVIEVPQTSESKIKKTATKKK